MRFDLNIHKRFRYLLFSGIYFSEGLYQAMILIVTPIYLLDKNVPIPLVTLIVGIGYLPWGLKFVWGGIIDYYHTFGRKKFAIIGTMIGAFGFFIISIIDQFFSIFYFALFLLIGYIGIGFLDSATDAWAIDISEKKDRGKINCSMNIGKYVGQYIGAMIIILLSVIVGYHISFLISGIILLFLVFLPLNVKYEDRRIKDLRIWLLIRQEFSKRMTQLTTLYFFVIVLQHALFFSYLTLYLKVILEFDDIFIGYLFAIWLVVVVPGSLIGGLLADRIGRKKTLYFILPMMAVSLVTPIFFSNIVIILINFSVTLLLLNAVISPNWAMVMDIINPKISAFEHEIICSIVNFGSVIMGSSVGTLFVLFGVENLFILAAIITLFALVVLSRIKGLEQVQWKH